MKSLHQDPGKTVYICDFVFIRRLRLEPVDSALFEFFRGQQKVNVFQFLWKHYHLQCRGSISPVIPSSRKHFNSRLPSLMLLISINTKFNVAVERVQQMLYPLKLRHWAAGNCRWAVDTLTDSGQSLDIANGLLVRFQTPKIGKQHSSTSSSSQSQNY